ncbi:MAG: RsmE family RNA methyltransferase [Bacteroidota bacterium]
MHVFFATDIADYSIILDSDESKHASRVLRLVTGDEVLVLDGKGNTFVCRIANHEKSGTVLEIISKTKATERSQKIIMAVAPTKSSDRLEWFVEKATELGFDQFIPVICSRSEKRKLNTERLRKITVAACKQSMNPWLPEISEPISLDRFIDTVKPGVIAHCLESEKNYIHDFDFALTEDIYVLIGPEGDFTPDEIQNAISKGWKQISLGNNRLRTETAALHALSSIILNQKIR